MVQLFKEYFIFCLDIVPAKTHCIAPKEDYSYSEGYVCFEYCICWRVWGCCNCVEVISHILKKLCLDTSSSNICSLVDINTALSVA